MDIDFLLLQRMKRGDENAFDVFVRKYYKEILNYSIDIFFNGRYCTRKSDVGI